jgi:hypothetical protein
MRYHDTREGEQLPTSVEAQLSILASKVDALAIRCEKIPGMESKVMTLTETVARLTVVEELRAQADQTRDAKLDEIKNQLSTPQPAQVRMLEMMEEQITRERARAEKAEDKRDKTLITQREADGKSDKWMRDIIMVIISALVGGGVIGKVAMNQSEPVTQSYPTSMQPSLTTVPQPEP